MNAILATLLALVIGVGLSRLLTFFVVYAFKDKMAVEETIRSASASQLDSLLQKCSSSGLSDQEKQQLQSSLMAYTMQATSRRTAKKYLDRAKSAKVDPALLTETEKLIQERFSKS